MEGEGEEPSRECVVMAMQHLMNVSENNGNGFFFLLLIFLFLCFWSSIIIISSCLQFFFWKFCMEIHKISSLIFFLILFFPPCKINFYAL